MPLNEGRAFAVLPAKIEGIGIVGDSLYACSSVMKICDGCNWDYIFTFCRERR